MNSQHKDPPLTVRPPAEVLVAARDVLRQRDREIRAYVTAALAALVDDPDDMLTRLARYWPERKPRGRPRKDDDS